MSFIFVLGFYFLCNSSVTKSSLFNITFTNNITIYNHKDYTGTHNALDSFEHIILSPAILILIFTFLYKTKKYDFVHASNRNNIQIYNIYKK